MLANKELQARKQRVHLLLNHDWRLRPTQDLLHVRPLFLQIVPHDLHLLHQRRWLSPTLAAALKTTSADGRYVSTSDFEDNDTAIANNAGNDNDHEMSEEEILGTQATTNYRTIIVQRALKHTSWSHGQDATPQLVFHLRHQRLSCSHHHRQR